MPKPKLTPMMERYQQVKRENPGSLLLFRMGDFYELFYEDAEVAAKVLGLTLTSRDKGSSNPIAMAGFPYHQLENYLQKIVRSGLRAAICEQVEDPRQAKGLVKREVTRVVTPGTLTDENLLDPRTSNYLVAVAPVGKRIGLAWLELSEGTFVVADLEPPQLADELARLTPAECLVPEGVRSGDLSVERGSDATSLHSRLSTLDCPLTERPPWCFSRDECERILLEHFGTNSLEGFDVATESAGVIAAGALLDYVRETQKSSLGHIRSIGTHRQSGSLVIDESTRRSLELTRTMRDGSRDGSLLDVVDETVTAMGARLLAEWLSSPLTDVTAIDARLDAVEEFVGEASLRDDVREQLSVTYDLQRLVARIATGRAGPRDLAALTRTLARLPKLKARLTARRAPLLQELEAALDLCADVRADVDNVLDDEPPLNVSDGGVIRPGCDERLDEFRELSRGGKTYLAEYQAREIERTGIPNLKIGFNKVFGYYFEVTQAHRDRVPDDYTRKQTLKDRERFVTPELKEYEDRVLRAEERALELERQLFEALRNRVAEHVPRLQTTARVLATVDVLAALGELAVRQRYCRPEITDEPILDVREGRHPVLDKLQPTGEFVPNDVRLGVETNRVQIITGPNMAGKSTYIRQAALLTVLAQTGSFVPASEARIGVADRVFARVGAGDELGRGRSTFMVEMTETARILNAATERSLVVLDEIGRGTSTYDGISLAWAVTEHLHDVTNARTLFATHYHELTDLTARLSRAANWNVAVREQGDSVVFLHRIVEGTADKSYGIHVARLAGIPDTVVTRARTVLATLESDHHDETGRPTIPDRPTRKSEAQLSLFGEHHPVLDELRDLDLDTMTPLAALERLHELRGAVTDDR